MARRAKRTPALISAVFTRDPDRVRTALSAKASVDDTDSDGRSALHHAAVSGDAEIVKLLIDAGASLNLADANGWTALHFAAQDQHAEVADLLLSAGAFVDPEDAHGNTPLGKGVFSSRGSGDLITLLLRYGADKNRTNRSGISPYDLARRIANYDVARWFEQ